MIDRRPALIAQCTSPEDVVQAVKFGCKHKLLVSIRGGGHNIAGNAVCDDGLMIDLSLMKDVQIDPNARRATVEPGCTLADFDAVAQAHGLATPLGINSTTGVAGLTLGGGFGWLSRKYGMTVDNLRSADVVTADGSQIHTSETENVDLLWGLRGGGGNFGIVTSFEFQLHPVGPNVLSGLIAFPFDQAKSVLTQFARFTETMPDDLNIWMVTRKAPCLWRISNFDPKTIAWTDLPRWLVALPCHAMKDLLILLVHLLTTIAKLLGPGGAKAIVADSLLMKQQILIMNRARRRAPNLTAVDRFLLGFWSLFLSPRHIQHAAMILRPSTLLKFHRLLKQRKSRQLYSANPKRKPGPEGPSPELIQAIVELKRRNPRFGCSRIAQQINKAFGTNIDKDVVRRVPANHYRPAPGGSGPSWLTFPGHTKDSLWSVDLFRCESILLKSHWVLVVMDQFTRRIIGFGVHPGVVNGIVLCRMFNSAIAAEGIPKYLSSDNDPLFQYYRWQANLRILVIQEIKSLPNVPLSHPFVERLIGTIRRELLDQVFFWNARDLERKLADFRHYYNAHRSHTALDDATPAEVSEIRNSLPADIRRFRWKSHCRGLYQLPVAA